MRLLVALFLLLYFPLHAAYVLKEGKLIKADQVATLSVQEHYSLAMEAFEKKQWDTLISESLILRKNFGDGHFGQEAHFFLGVGYFYLDDCELSNKYLSRYLQKQTTPKHFEEAIYYKFELAKRFHDGAKKHVLGWKEMPKWVPAQDEALALYDEVIAALPNHDLAAHALFGKACLHFSLENYKESVESFQTLIRRFPKHPLGPESYLKIGEVYLEQSQKEYPDPDFLDLSYINLRRFRQDFPGEERVIIAEQKVKEMEDVYARSLYDTGKFYERIKKPQAAAIYYNKVLKQYPSAKVADLSQKKLSQLAVKEGN